MSYSYSVWWYSEKYTICMKGSLPILHPNIRHPFTAPKRPDCDKVQGSKYFEEHWIELNLGYNNSRFVEARRIEQDCYTLQQGMNLMMTFLTYCSVSFIENVLFNWPLWDNEHADSNVTGVLSGVSLLEDIAGKPANFTSGFFICPYRVTIGKMCIFLHHAIIPKRVYPNVDFLHHASSQFFTDTSFSFLVE